MRWQPGLSAARVRSHSPGAAAARPLIRFAPVTTGTAMNEDPSRRRLGRGLAALIGEIDRPAQPQEAKVPADRTVPIEFLSPNPRNPRRNFAEAELADLAQSIREHGIVQP